jgi:hypothetical protein
MDRCDGTYVAFHANGTNIPVDSDIKYYNLLMAWTNRPGDDFYMVNSHAKTSAVRDTSLRETLERRLVRRLRLSTNMVLILGPSTFINDDLLRLEIEYAVDVREMPLIIAYTGYELIDRPDLLSHLWPDALAERIDTGAVRAIHVPFKKEPLKAAIREFSLKYRPRWSLTIYTDAEYRRFGILA